MTLCPVCGAYWRCDHEERPEDPVPEPTYVDTSVIQYGETIHGYDLRDARMEPRDTEAGSVVE